MDLRLKVHWGNVFCVLAWQLIFNRSFNLFPSSNECISDVMDIVYLMAVASVTD